jgi:hypothetical protein
LQGSCVPAAPPARCEHTRYVTNWSASRSSVANLSIPGRATAWWREAARLRPAGMLARRPPLQ